MSQVVIDGVVIKTDCPITLQDLLKRENKLHGAIVAFINGTCRDLTTTINDNDNVVLCSFEDRIGRQTFWHTCAHILAQAITNIWPQALPTIGPSTEDGFFYDFDNVTIEEKDIPQIEQEVGDIIKSNLSIQRVNISSIEAMNMFAHNQYKLEIISQIPIESEITAYRHGDFIDLCRGPHITSTGLVKAFKITKISGAYWKSNSNNKMLCRVHGTGFTSIQLLKEHLKTIEEAKKYDHKIIGPQLGLFMLLPEAPGLPFILPNGNIVWERLVKHIDECQHGLNYRKIQTPMMMDRSLWVKSGHWDNYSHNMYHTSIESRSFAIKPMNCPGAALVYKSDVRSYKQLPFRIFEIGHVHRYESSGSLSGLVRVRGFHQDDSHTYLSLDDVESEIILILQLVKKVYAPFGLEYKLELSTKPDKECIGGHEKWKIATQSLENSLIKSGHKYTINPGDGAFYGPKIDIHVKDCLKRHWQCATIQLDLFQGCCFDLEYIGKDNQRHKPVVIHRAIYGSIERFMGILIEHFRGKLPLWLNPNPIIILPVSNSQLEYSRKVLKLIQDNNIICVIDESSETLQKKIKNASKHKFLYTLVLGNNEEISNSVSIRIGNKIVNGLDLNMFIEQLNQEIAQKHILSPYITKE